MTNLERTASFLVFSFFALTIYSVTITGYFEEARIDVAHFSAGAGSYLLILRTILCLAGVIALLVVAHSSTRALHKVLILSCAVAVPVAFFWSCLGLERWAPGYTETAFSTLVDKFNLADEPISPQEVVAAIGPPLCESVYGRGGSTWSYSFMPSGGFGWSKRIVFIENDIVKDIWAFNEP